MARGPASLGIGTATFLAAYGLPGTCTAETPGAELLRRAVERGVRYLDTAASYGDGELAVSRASAPGVRVCTKIPASGTLTNVRASIERLGMTPDTILMHSADREQMATAPAIAALREAREQGLARRIGASTYGAEDAAFALSLPWVDVIQMEYSILNQSVVRSVTRARAGQEIVVRSVLCKGLLTSRRSAAPHLVAGIADALDGIERCAREANRSIEELAIRFALDTPGVDIVVVGVSDARELDAALAAAASPRLLDDERARLAAFDRSDVDAAHPERWSRVS